MRVRQVIREANDREQHPVVLESIGRNVLSSNRMGLHASFLRKLASATRCVSSKHIAIDIV